MTELLLSEQNHVKTYLVQDSKFGATVIKKVLDHPSPNSSEIREFLFEYSLLENLDIKGIRKPLAIEEENNKQIVVFDYVEGLTLKKVVQSDMIDLRLALHAGMFLAELISELHTRNVIHKNLNSHNVIYNPDRKTFGLIDFSHASTFHERKHLLGSPTFINGDLGYISPEQTGRMNRKVTGRSDLYSIGIILYELLTGHLPFSSENPIEIVHAHIAKSPDLDQLTRAAPPPVVRIVEKLLSKDADGRYQSGSGLAHDLRKCLSQLDEKDSIKPFKIGLQDFSHELHVSQKLYGREDEIKLLQSEFNRVRKGDSRVLMITGHSGVGKSALIYEVYKSLSQANGYFIKGKFDQLQRNIPYYAISQAFREYVTFLLTEPDEVIDAIRKSILAGLGSEAGLITEIEPSFELIIGKQPDVPDLQGIEAQNRFNYAFLRLMRVITSRGNPIVMFIDDLQWVDTASMQLIGAILRDRQIQHFLFAGAYRNNEVSGGHRLQRELNDLTADEVAINQLELSGLSQQDVQNLLADTLGCDLKSVSGFAQILHQRTLGNAFYINQVLTALFEEGHLIYDTKSHHWVWNETYINDLQISENVIDLLVSKVQKLDEGTQKLLQAASCIGNSSNRDQLSLIVEQTLDLDQALTIVLEQELMEKSDEVTISFAHDRIQQAVYSMISVAEKEVIHLQIGRTLLEKQGEKEENLFDIVDQLNAGKNLVTDPHERLHYAGMNLKAGIRAKNATAYDSAFEYFLAGIAFSDAKWTDHHQLLRALHSNAAEVAHLEGKYDEVTIHADTVIRQSSTLLDQIPVYKVVIDSLKSQNRLAEAVEKGLEILRLLGIRMPYSPSRLRILAELLWVKLVFGRRRPATLLEHRSMKNEAKIASMQILVSIGPAIYWASPNLIPLTVFNMVLLSLRHGNSNESPFAYSTYGLLQCGITGEIRSGNRFGKLALDLTARVNAPNRVKGIFNVYCFVHHWQHPLNDSFRPFLDNFQAGLQTGDLEFAALSAYLYCNHSFYNGENLVKLDEEMQVYSDEIKQIRQYTSYNYTLLHWQALKNLRGETSDPLAFNGPVYKEQSKLSKHVEAGDSTALFKFHLLKQMLCCLFHEYDQAIEHADKGHPYIQAVTGMFVTPMYHYYTGVTLIGTLIEQPGKRSLLRKLQATRSKLKKWMAYAPENHAHRFHLLDAGYQQVMNNTEKARIAYGRAIRAVQENGFIQDAGLIYEMAGRFYRNLGEDNLADHYFINAFLSYKNWGAESKCQDIKSRYHLDTRIDRFFNQLTAVSRPVVAESALNQIDMGSVLEASTSISQEIKFDRLKSQLMKILVENMGAQRGVLLIPSGDELDVAIQWPESNTSGFAATIVSMVHKTHETVVTDNAQSDARYGKDPFITNQKVRSLLCFPAIHQGDLAAVIYLENNLVFGAFSSQRMEMLKLLTGQIAASLKNAALYQNLSKAYEEQVELTRIAARSKEVERQKKEIEGKNFELTKLNEEIRAQKDLKDKFFSIISHDLRGPVAAFQGISNMIQYYINHKSYEDLDEMSKEINQSANQLSRLLDNLLNWATHEQGQITYNPEKIQVVEMINTLLESFTATAKAKNIHLINQLRISSVIWADRNSTYTIFRNLINNALKFTPEGGRIELTSEEDKEFVSLHVRDNGIGIPASKMESLFTLTEAKSTYGTGGEKGVGLGLQLVNEFTRLNKGELSVDSEVGKGTTFSVRLPKKDH